MIETISVENFKSIRKISNLELKPLTIFTGENSTGKSNILESISLFFGATEIIRENRTPNITQLFNNGPFMKYPLPLENYIVYKKNPQNTVKFEIITKLDADTKDWFERIFLRNEKSCITKRSTGHSGNRGRT